MFGQQKTEVLVVGAGPVGLFTALSLATRGISVTIVDKRWRTHGHSYALALHADSLHLLDNIAMAQELIMSGHMVNKLVFYDGMDRKSDVVLSQLETDFPYVLVLPQSSLEWALESRLQQRKIKVLWNHEVTNIQHDGDHLIADITRYDKQSLGYPIARTEWVVDKQFKTRASHIVGADGYNSRIRDHLGVNYRTFGDPLLFTVMEFYAALDFQHEARVVLDDNSMNVLWPMTDKRCRWTFQIDDLSQHAPTSEKLKDLVQERAPWFTTEPSSIIWSSSVQFESRLADRFAHQNIWLAGDAAHLTGPIGAQSMNVGLREAHEVAWRITKILREGGSQDLVDSYNEERFQEWGRLLGLEGKLACAEDTDDWMKKHSLDILSSLPASGDNLTMLLAQIGMVIH